MALTQVFNGSTIPTQPNLSSRFKDAIAFFIVAPDLSVEVEIDVFLQIYLPFNQVRNIPLGKITEQAVLLNLTDTESVSVIPEQFQDTDFEMSLLFLPSQAFTLEAWVITKQVTLSALQQQLVEIAQNLELVSQNSEPSFLDNNAIDVIDTIADIGLAVNALLPLVGIPSIPTLPANPGFLLLPGIL